MYNVETDSSPPRVFSRGRAEAIEAIIHATRIQVYLKQRDQTQTQQLLHLYNEAKSVIHRVASSQSPEVYVIRELDQLMHQWRQKPR